MCAYGFDDRRRFACRKSKPLQDYRRFPHCIRHVVPFRQSFDFLRAVADKDSEVMQPCRREKHVVIERLSVSQFARQLIQTGLVIEFVRRLRLFSNMSTQLAPPGRFRALRHSFLAAVFYIQANRVHLTGRMADARDFGNPSLIPGTALSPFDGLHPRCARSIAARAARALAADCIHDEFG
jgi:hypothetical protein